MRKKYTMEEFKIIFENAMIRTIEKLEEDFKNATGEDKGLNSFAFTMQNLLAMKELEKTIFNGGQEDE